MRSFSLHSSLFYLHSCLLLIVVVLNLGEVSVYKVALLAALCACTLSAAHVRVALRCLLLIDLAGQIGELLGQALGCSLDHIGIGALERFLNLFDLSLNACLLICGQLVAQIGQCLLGLEYQLLSVVANLNCFLVLLNLSQRTAQPRA